MNIKSKKSLPKSIIALIELGIQKLNPQKIVLFGSQARGDARKHSDYDLAFYLGKHSTKAWNKFCIDSQEEPITLHEIDLVHFEEATSSLKTKIEEEGVVLYDKNQTD